MNVHFDLETQDPDDVLTLCVLATHPRVNLRSVSVFPGGKDQIGIVRNVLNRLDRSDVKVGAEEVPDPDKPRVSGFHYKWLGKVPKADPDDGAVNVIKDTLNKYPDCRLLTGAALRNIKKAANGLDKIFTHWTCQGGFAGDNVVPEERRLPKFNGKIICPTYNLNGDPKAALQLLEDKRITLKQMVSKNICHGVFYDKEFHASLSRGKHAGLDLLIDAMELYLARHKDGKALHDTVAAAIMIEPELAKWAKGTPYREKGMWGFNEDSQGQVFITTGFNKESFSKVLEE